MAQSDTDGNLTIGELIRTTAPIYCMEGQERFVWFGWSNYDTTSTGLGRVDLSQLVGALAPAYASDLMATTQGAVQAVVTFGTLRVFTVSGKGVYAESSTNVASGTVESGHFTYGLIDRKTGLLVTLQTEPLAGSITVYLRTNHGSYVAVGSVTTADETLHDISTNEQVADSFELKVELTRGSGAVGPVLSRTTFHAYPAPTRGEVWVVPLLLHDDYDVDGATVHCDPKVELDLIRDLVNPASQLVLFQLAGSVYRVFVEEFQFFPHHLTRDRNAWNGTCVVRLKSVDEETV
jgi:hypothetical protein